MLGFGSPVAIDRPGKAWELPIVARSTSPKLARISWPQVVGSFWFIGWAHTP